MGLRALTESAAKLHLGVTALRQGLTTGWASQNTSAVVLAPLERLRVLAVVPGDGQGSSFIFVRRQLASLTDVGVNVRTFFVGSRISPVGIAKEWGRLRREICQFRPDLVHAHYGTVTSLVCAMATSVPLVITFRGNDLGDDPDIGLLRSRLGQVLSQISCLKAK